MLAHPLTNFEIQEYYKSEPRYNGVYSRDNLPKTIKNGGYVINLDEYEDVQANIQNTSRQFSNVWILLYWIH